MTIATDRKLAWITGGGTGIGRALAIELVQHGWHVAISGRTESSLHEVSSIAPAGTISTYVCDVTDLAAVRDTAQQIRQLGAIDLAVFNAGTYQAHSAAEFTAESVQQTHEVNNFGVVYGIDAVLTDMRERGSGHIAVVASVAGYRGLPMAAAYSSSKAAVIAMAESLKFDLDAMGIKITVVCPGFVKTPLTDKNTFNMPFMVSAEYAAKRIREGLEAGNFEINFPRRLSWSLKLAQRLPYAWYFPLLKRLMQ